MFQIQKAKVSNLKKHMFQILKSICGWGVQIHSTSARISGGGTVMLLVGGTGLMLLLVLL